MKTIEKNKFKINLDRKQGFLLDMDGVLYKGESMIPGAKEFISYLQKNSVPHLFLTNNSRPTPRDIAYKLTKKIGIKVSEESIYTSAMSTAHFLSSQVKNGSAFVLGEGGLQKALYDVGYSINEQDPDYVVVGESRVLTLEVIERAIDLIIAGSKLIATNLDPSPKVKGWPKPGTGAVIKMLEEASGKKCLCLGKPSPILMHDARKYLGLRSEQTVMVGDTMETDIIGGISMGYKTILVLTGATHQENLHNYPYTPHYISDSVKDLLPKETEVLKKDKDLKLTGVA